MYGTLREFFVYLNGKKIDKVFYSEWSQVTEEDVVKSLINHDGYDSNITVVERIRNVSS